MYAHDNRMIDAVRLHLSNDFDLVHLMEHFKYTEKHLYEKG